jgi:hypothetical protein
MMRYALLIYRDEAAAAQMSPQDREALMAGHEAFVRLLGRRLLDGGPLLPTGAAVTVRLPAGKVLVTDGPFAETKEQLAGFYVVECKDLDEALDLAARIPDATAGSIEVRPLAEIE